MQLGIIAESLPLELKSQTIVNRDGSENIIPSINLTNWMGLNSVVIKHLLSENKELKAKLEDLLVEFEKIKNRLAILENDI